MFLLLHQILCNRRQQLDRNYVNALREEPITLSGRPFRTALRPATSEADWSLPQSWTISLDRPSLAAVHRTRRLNYALTLQLAFICTGWLYSFTIRLMFGVSSFSLWIIIFLQLSILVIYQHFLPSHQDPLSHHLQLLLYLLPFESSICWNSSSTVRSYDRTIGTIDTKKTTLNSLQFFFCKSITS